MSLSESEELVGSFAEMIGAERDPSSLWPSMLVRLQEVIGFDAGYIAATWATSFEGRAAVAEHDATFLKQNLGRYLAEIRPEEVAMYADRARVHHDVWSRPRQLELAVFREVLDPSGMRHMIVRASVRQGNVAGFNLERRDVALPYGDRELRLVDLVAPFLHLVEILTLRAQDDGVLREFVAEHGLTKRESEFVALAARGLQNSEIALLTKVSANTVRNALARIFQKVGVTNRAELAYVAAQAKATHRAQQEVVPPASDVPDDGVRTFAARVAEAHVASTTNEGAPRPRFRPARIVYLAP